MHILTWCAVICSRQGSTAQGNPWQGRPGQGGTRQGSPKQGSTRQGSTRQGSTNLDGSSPFPHLGVQPCKIGRQNRVYDGIFIYTYKYILLFYLEKHVSKKTVNKVSTKLRLEIVKNVVFANKALTKFYPHRGFVRLCVTSLFTQSCASRTLALFSQSFCTKP